MRDPELISRLEVKTGSNVLPSAVAVVDIEVGYRLRALDLEKVAALKASIEEIGLRTPISLRRMEDDDGQWRLVLTAGAHRLEAVRQLGREWIAAIVRDEEDLDAELWEIDENLCRAELTPADRALFVFRRKEIYLMRHPQSDHGGDRKSSRQRGELNEPEAKRFTAATAEATGQSERAIQRDAERGEKISEKALRMLRGTRHDKGVVLDRLKGLKDEYQEIYVRELFEDDRRREGEAKVIRTEKMATKRAVRTGIINAIASHGRMTAGEMPRAAYPIGYCDFPWEQEAWSDQTGQDKGLMYPAMTVDEGKALCAGDNSPFTPDALLFFWVTTNRLRDGLSIIEAWGFSYVTMITWDKVHIGMGRWVRDRTEHLLICKRGDFPGLEMGSQPESLFSEVKTEHSRKPVFFAETIDRLFPDMRKLELFNRKASLADGDVRHGDGWGFYGFEAAGQVAVEDAAEAEIVPPPAPEKPEKKPRKVKDTRSAWQIQREQEAALRLTYRQTLPEDDEGLIVRAWQELQSYHAAVHVDINAMARHFQNLNAIVEHLFGITPAESTRALGTPPNGNGRFFCLNDAQKWLVSHLRAADGEIPLFGQPGRFLINLFGCRVDFSYEGLFGFCSGDARIVDLDKPFFSETGFRSFNVTPDQGITYAGGMDLKAYVERVCTAQFTEGGKKKVKLVPLERDSAWLIDRRKTDPAYQAGGFLDTADLVEAAE